MQGVRPITSNTNPARYLLDHQQPKLNPDKALAELCKRPGGFFRFVKEFWFVIIPEDPIWNWHIEYLCDEAQQIVLQIAKFEPYFNKEGKLIREGKPRQPKEGDFLLNVPPGTTKSTIFSVMLPAWAWTIDPTLRILTASYSQTLSTDFALKSRDIIRSEKYKRLFGEIEIKTDQDNKTHYKNNKNGERYATSVTGTATGFHAHLIIVDDPLNAKEEASEAALLTANSFMDTTLSTRKIDKAVTVIMLIMQRLNENDPSGNWLNKKGKKLKHIRLPAINNGDNVHPPEVADNYIDGLLDPLRLSQEILDENKIDLGEYGFAGQMQQDPAPETGGIWQKWFIPIPDKEFPTPDELEQYGTDWDTAFTKDDNNAASASVTAGKKDNKMYIDNFDYVYKEFPDLIVWMAMLPDPHYIEAKASGKSAKQTLVNNGINAIEVEVKGGADKVARARMATPYAQAGRVCVRQSILDRLYNDSEQGVLKFPKQKKLDVADALAQAIQRLLGKKDFKFW